MELLQQIDLKAVDGGQKSADMHARSKQAGGSESEENKPFKDQLNKQIDRVKSKPDNQNIDNNQQDKKNNVEGDQNERALTTDADTGAETSDSAELVENTSDNSLHQGDLSEQTEGDELNPLIATVLPETGSILPLSTGSVQVVNPAQGAQFLSTSGPAVVAIESQQANSGIDAKTQRINDLINNVPVSSVTQNSEAITSTKPLNIPANLTATLSEKTNIQDARYTKVVSEMPTTDVIAQTSRLQQVPLATAVSSSVSVAQNLSATPAVESLNTGFTGLLNTATSTTATTTLSSSIATSIQNPNWSQQMTQQVSYMIRGGFQQAEIKLNPANLGPMEIKLSMKDDQASINFVTQHAPVRDALDAALPRLKEMLEQQGLNLADVDVSTQSEQQQASGESQQDGAVESQNDLASENTIEGNVDGELLVNMDVNSGVSIFA